MEVTDETWKKVEEFLRARGWSVGANNMSDIRAALTAALPAPTTPSPLTRRVRIAVACAPDDPNYWDACGIKNDMTEADAWEVLDNNEGLTKRLAIVEANVPLPTVPTVRGRVAHEVDEWCRTMTLEASATFAGKPDKMAVAEAMVASIRLLAADIRALPDEDEWLPIETAPRDGTWMQVYDPCLGVRAARWDKMFEWWSYAVGDGVYRSITYRPTMWCPFAAPPEGGE